MEPVTPYSPVNKIRLVTAASLFDGHDVSINIMRRILQASGAEVVHLGHNRSAREIVNCAIQEDVQGIAITSYQGGHNEYFRYVFDLLKEAGASHIRIFGGGGGVILPSEIDALHTYGIARIYSPDDGRHLGLQGMINDLLRTCDFALGTRPEEFPSRLNVTSQGTLARAITMAENGVPGLSSQISALKSKQSAELVNRVNGNNAVAAGTETVAEKCVPVIGITGTGGAGKSSLTDELIRRFLSSYPAIRLAVLSIDPSRKKSGGALLGDRIRMNAIDTPRVYMRSLATRQFHQSLSGALTEAIELCQIAGYDLILIETSGIGQSDSDITGLSNLALYVMTPEFGAASQLEKIDMLDFADLIAINKADKKGAEDAVRDVKKQYVRNHSLFDTPAADLPVFSTIASQFNDPGTNQLFIRLITALAAKKLIDWAIPETFTPSKVKEGIIPPRRVRYLAEIAEAADKYELWVNRQSDLATQLYQLRGSQELLKLHQAGSPDKPQGAAGNQSSAVAGDHANSLALDQLHNLELSLARELDPGNTRLLENWPLVRQRYKEDEFIFHVRDKEIRQQLYYTSLSGSRIPKVALPAFKDSGDLLRWLLRENLPGEFPYAAGVFALKREGEDPTRMFAGEGGPERTNKRFHYVSKGQAAKRLSTAFDSVTLYGEDPDERPDIYGKIGNAGVSIATLDDAKKLYSGFNLCAPATSVSMTINGPAPMLLSYFLHAAIDQQCELYIRQEDLVGATAEKIDRYFKAKGQNQPHYSGNLPDGNNGLGLMLLGLSGADVLPPDVYQHIRAFTLTTVRGTVQADILKEDQAQNTCIFSTEFALKMMGDTQEFFNQEKVRNFYSVSISGYHIAEAGANPISQLAFTLSNGFTFVEYYLSRGLKIDDFAPNLSFFFSNGIDPEYAVIGRVARRIWAKAIRNVYGGNERSQKLKYHIQTSGRSLHAQEIDFNDIRTTLQALYALNDNCNSLHTNAYDEAITTPTEESVRRAMAIQLIITNELGLAKNENPLQGAFIIEELSDLVEQAVMEEFRRISERGGVLGAMETMYQRGKIQEESLYYETMKHDGTYPIIGVNTFLNSKGSPTLIPAEIIRATEEEKREQITNLLAFHHQNTENASRTLQLLKESALRDENIFNALMQAARYCSLGQITHVLYQVGGQYRRNM